MSFANLWINQVSTDIGSSLRPPPLPSHGCPTLVAVANGINEDMSASTKRKRIGGPPLDCECGHCEGGANGCLCAEKLKRLFLERGRGGSAPAGAVRGALCGRQCLVLASRAVSWCIMPVPRGIAVAGQAPPIPMSSWTRLGFALIFALFDDTLSSPSSPSSSSHLQRLAYASPLRHRGADGCRQKRDGSKNRSNLS